MRPETRWHSAADRPCQLGVAVARHSLTVGMAVGMAVEMAVGTAVGMAVGMAAAGCTRYGTGRMGDASTLHVSSCRPLQQHILHCVPGQQ